MADLGYGQVGALRYITADWRPQPDSATLPGKRVAALIARLRSLGGFQYIVECHGEDPTPAGYYQAPYPAGWS